MNAFKGVELHGKVVLELGCGFGAWGHLLRAISEGESCYIVGCDIFKPYLQKLRNFCPYDDLVLCDARNPPFRPRSANIIMAFEIIEHLDKNEGVKFLFTLQDLCDEKIIVSTPYGYYKQGGSRNNKFEQHTSAWSRKDFENASYIVNTYGFGIELENVIRKLHLESLWQIITKSILKAKWSRCMLVATKEPHEKIEKPDN